MVAVLLRPWTWRDWRAAVFAAGWTAGASSFAILALFPYVADRFLYLADVGLALLLGAATAEVLRAWPAAGTGARVGLAAGATVVAAWLAIGPVALAERGRLWAAAGAQARAIVEATVRLVPDPPPRATIVFSGPLDSYAVTIPPGNTGPYLFRTGIGAALRLAYGRPDLRGSWRGRRSPDAIHLSFEDGQVRRVAPRRPAQRRREPRSPRLRRAKPAGGSNSAAARARSWALTTSVLPPRARTTRAG